MVAWASLLVALLTSAAWLFIEASHMSGTALGAVLPNGVIPIVLSQTQFGKVWVLRFGLIVVLAACLVVQSRSRTRMGTWIGLLASGAFLATLAWAGHAGATEDVPLDALHLPADLLHLLATGAWLGALLPLALLLRSANDDGGAAALASARRAVLRFSTLGITCVGILLVTGIINTLILSGSIPALVGTAYGQLLLLKIAFFAAMIVIASVNRQRLIPQLPDARVLPRLSRNATIEASFGIGILAIVAIIGTLAPGSHTEPQWPFPFRIALNEVTSGAQRVLDVAAILFLLCLVAIALAARRHRVRFMAASIIGLVLCGSVGGVTLRPGVVRAYPTTYYASTQAYAAPSVARGAPLFGADCAACHGADGRGDGPIAKRLPIHAADLTQGHIFAHNVGDLFWWISYGKAGGVMPGFAGTLTPEQRWDVIDFVLARAAGIQTELAGSQITASAAPSLPDFAFEQNGTQNTLGQLLKKGPVLLVLFTSRPPRARLEHLARLKLTVIAIDVEGRTAKAPLVVDVSSDVRDALKLFHARGDGGETELMLDRNGTVRARWTAKVGLASAPSLLADIQKVARTSAAAANHAGHGG